MILFWVTRELHKIKKRTQKNPFKYKSNYPELLKEKFDIIYADPPWDYNGKTQYDKSIIKKKILNSEKIFF